MAENSADTPEAVLHHPEDTACSQINSPSVADEVIDGEVIIINLVTGNYYSLLETGAEVWQWLRSGAPFSEVVANVTARYEGDVQEIRNSVGSFIGELQREGLIIPLTDGGVAPENLPIPEAPLAEKREVFTEPQLSVYIDMQKMLLLDPIHEVDSSGWPEKTPELE